LLFPPSDDPENFYMILAQPAWTKMENDYFSMGTKATGTG
jgi:hypothetical protein